MFDSNVNHYAANISNPIGSSKNITTVGSGNSGNKHTINWMQTTDEKREESWGRPNNIGNAKMYLKMSGETLRTP